MNRTSFWYKDLKPVSKLMTLLSINFVFWMLFQIFMRFIEAENSNSFSAAKVIAGAMIMSIISTLISNWSLAKKAIGKNKSLLNASK